MDDGQSEHDERFGYGIFRIDTLIQAVNSSSSDTKEQIKIFFDTKEKAIEWSKKNNEQFIVIEPKERKIKPKNYASNFDMNRKEPWTH